MKSKKDVYYFRCLQYLKIKGIMAMSCSCEPEGILITMRDQYEIIVIHAWVDENGEYTTKLLFTVENDKERLIEIIDDIVKRLYSYIEEPEASDYNPLEPIIVGETLMYQILD